MSTTTLDQGPSLKDAMVDYWARIKSGDIGALPAVLGLVVLCGVFGAMSNVFLTPGNFANLLTQAAAVTVIAMGGLGGFWSNVVVGLVGLPVRDFASTRQRGSRTVVGLI